MQEPTLKALFLSQKHLVTLANKACIPGKTIFQSMNLLLYLFAVEKRMVCVGKKVYIVYADIGFCCLNRRTKMKSHHNNEKIRWQVVKAMLDDFLALRKKVKRCIEKAENLAQPEKG
jgi:hypothetical protein